MTERYEPTVMFCIREWGRGAPKGLHGQKWSKYIDLKENGHDIYGMIKLDKEFDWLGPFCIGSTDQFISMENQGTYIHR